MSDKEEVDPIFYDMTLIGISKNWKAAVADEAWIIAASKEIRKVGPQEYLKNMVRILREKLGGKEKKEPVDQHSNCSCGSGKKFARCCASLYENGDPEDCLAHGHDWSPWKKLEKSGRYFRNCSRCNGLENAYDACEMTLKDDLKILSIGCEACQTTAVDMDEVYGVVQRYHETHACAACGKPFNTNLLVVGHVKKPGGCILEVTDKELRLDDFMDLASEGALDGQAVGVHEVCFEKILPYWKRVFEA